MKLFEVKKRSDELIRVLTDVWEESVRETHLFLTEADIAGIAREVPAALHGVSHLVIAEEAEGMAAFMGVEADRLEMLFVSANTRGKGLGKQLLEYGMAHYDVRWICVNEQNSRALGFYEHMGFVIDRRTAEDEQGRPFPLLYLKRRPL